MKTIVYNPTPLEQGNCPFASPANIPKKFFPAFSISKHFEPNTKLSHSETCKPKPKMASTPLFYRCGCRAGIITTTHVTAPDHLCPEVLPHVCTSCQQDLDALFSSPIVIAVQGTQEDESRASQAAETVAARGEKDSAEGIGNREGREGQDGEVLGRARLVARLSASGVR